MRKRLACLIVMVLPALAGADNEDREKQAKKLGQQAVKLILASDADDLLKLIAVPWYAGDKSVLKTEADVKTRLKTLLASKDFKGAEANGSKAERYAKFRKFLDEKEQKAIDEAVTPDDYAVFTRTMKDGKEGTIVVWVRFRDGKPKVVGISGDPTEK